MELIWIQRVVFQDYKIFYKWGIFVVHSDYLKQKKKLGYGSNSLDHIIKFKIVLKKFHIIMNNQ